MVISGRTALNAEALHASLCSANLYRRGDSALLQPLLQLAESGKDVILEIGTFYAGLLDRRTAASVDGLRKLPQEKQRVIRKPAGDQC